MKKQFLFNTFAILFACLFISLNSNAQKNSDGSYAVYAKDGSMKMYYPKHPGNVKNIDTLAVPNAAGTMDLYYRINETPVKATEAKSKTKSKKEKK